MTGGVGPVEVVIARKTVTTRSVTRPRYPLQCHRLVLPSFLLRLDPTWESSPYVVFWCTPRLIDRPFPEPFGNPSRGLLHRESLLVLRNPCENLGVKGVYILPLLL